MFIERVCIRARGAKQKPSAPMANNKLRTDRECDPIADLARLITQGDASGGSAAIDYRFRQETASEGRDETPGLPDLNALEQALQQEYELHECRHDETRDVDDLADEEYKTKVPRVRRRGLALVMAITALALVGTAGAFDYRNIFGGPVSQTPPPGIKAINERNTIASVSEPQAASNSDARQVGPANTGSIDNTVALEGQPATVGPLKPRENEPAMPATGQAVPTQAVPRVAVATDPGQPPSPVLGSGYAVQVTSERTERGAQAAFGALQAKYPNQLSGRQVMIRRAELGAAGIYYRALVGPFPSAEKAAKLCRGLKAAGGDCIILKI